MSVFLPGEPQPVPYTVVVRPDGRMQAAGHVSAGKLKSVVAEALGQGRA